MCLLILDSSLVAYASGNTCIALTPGKLSSAVSEVLNTYPQLYIKLFGAGDQSASKYAFIYNDEAVLEPSDFYEMHLYEGDTVELLEYAPSGSDAVSIGTAIIDAAANAGVISAATWAAAGTLTANIIGSIVLAGVMIALNVVMGALSGGLAAPDIHSGSLDNSATNTFSGIKNTTASGTPVPIVYGLHRTGGQVLSLFTEGETTTTTDASGATLAGDSDTYLFYQLGVSEGEVADITAVEINKLPSHMYSAVATAPDPAYVQKGSRDQSIMAGFNKIMNTTSLGLKVRNTSTDLSQTPVVYTEYVPVKGYVYQLGKSGGWKYAVKLGIYDTNGYE